MLQGCLNGDRSKSFHAALPVTAGELAADAATVVAAGANELHVHPRDDGGLETLDPGAVAAALLALRAAVPGVPVGLSTRWQIPPTGRARQHQIAAWTELPDYVSVNLIEDDAVEVMQLVADRGIWIEAGLWSVEDARRFVALKNAPVCLRVLIEINEQDIAEGCRAAQAIIDVLDGAGVRLPRLLHGCDQTKWPVFDLAVRHGYDTRIGFEDGKWLPGGSEASDNAALIAAARRMIETARNVR